MYLTKKIIFWKLLPIDCNDLQLKSIFLYNTMYYMYVCLIEKIEKVPDERRRIQLYLKTIVFSFE